MPHEELMRRARAGASSKITTNISASVLAKPIVVTPPPVAQPSQPVTSPPASGVVKPAAIVPTVKPAEPIPSAAAKPKQSKPKTATFSEVPPEFYETAPTPSQIPSAVKSTGATSTNAMAALDDKHLLAIGDRLSFRIVEDEEDPRALLITDSGELEVPYLGRFPAEGKTCKQLALALKAALEKDYYFQATVVLAVDVLARSRGKVYLVGPVRAPGPQEIPSDEVLTLSKAILRAGGFTDFADKKSVKVTRKEAGESTGDRTFTVNVEEILEKGRRDADLQLQPGDLVYIQERMIRF